MNSTNREFRTRVFKIFGMVVNVRRDDTHPSDFTVRSTSFCDRHLADKRGREVSLGVRDSVSLASAAGCPSSPSLWPTGSEASILLLKLIS